MNRRVFSQSFSLSKVQEQLSNDIQKLQNQSTNNQVHYLKKQNGLLKKQLEQSKQMQKQTRKQLQIYRNLLHQKTLNSQTDTQINQVLQMQHKRIFDLQTQLQISQQKYAKSIANSGSKKQTEYAVRCKQLEKILRNSQIQYQKEIATLKHKLMKYNASEIIQSATKRLPTSPSTELKPVTGHFRKFLS